MVHTLERPRESRVFAGVCAAVARRFDWSPTTVRVIAVLGGLFFFGVTVPIYIALWIIIPAA